ncbi:hypothetical protein MTO96_051984 [Rhipicephalus appendiculatus]
MGKAISRVWRKDEPSDTTGMSPREKMAVRIVWSAFCKEHPDYGVLLFNAYFLKYPDNINLFERFKGKNLRTLATDHEFSAHCSVVGQEITSIIEALDNVLRLVEILEKNALFHRHIRGVTPAHFTTFGQFVVSFTTVAYEKSGKSVLGSSASSYKVATMSTYYGAQPRRTVSSTGTHRSTASDSTARGAVGRRTSTTDGNATGAAPADMRRRQSITRKSGENIALPYRKASLPTDSHPPHTIDRLVRSEPVTSAARSGSRRSSVKSLTDLSGKKPADFPMTSQASTSKRRASIASLGKGSDVGKPTEDQSAASDKSQSKSSQQSQSLSKRSSSNIRRASISDKEKPK